MTAFRDEDGKNPLLPDTSMVCSDFPEAVEELS